MKQIFSILAIAFFFSGCINETPRPDQKSLQNLQDVHYRLNKKGNLTLQKKYVVKDNKTGITTEQTTQKSVVEKVPIFDKNYKKQLSLKGKAKKEIAIHGDTVKVSVESIPLNEFVDLVFGSVLKLNYTVDESVKKMNKPITLNMQTSQKGSQFYKVVKKILLLNGVKVSDENNLLFIHKLGKSKENAVNSDVYIGYGRSLPANLDEDKEVLLFVPYNYIKPKTAAIIVRQAGISNIKFYYLIDGIQTIKAKASIATKALKLINLIDKPYLEGKIPYLVTLQNIEVEKFVQQIKKIYALNGINIVDTPSKGGIVMMPIEDLNMLYFITPKKEWLDMLLYWKKKLDVQTDVQEEPRLYIYHVKNRKADELASAIKEVLGLSQKNTETIIRKKTDIAKQKTQIKSNKHLPGGFLLNVAGYIPTVTADLDTNILMLKLTPKHYRVLLPFIQELDKLPLQTLVEVTVANVDMTDSFSLGFEYAISNRDSGIAKDILNISGGGSGLGVVFQGNKLQATINAYAEKKLLNIVSEPKLLILNNKAGNINIGTQVPIITSQVSATDLPSSPNNPSINQNISYKNTGIIMSITPTINSNGVLTLDISITLSDAQTNDTSTINSPLIINRSLQTTAVVKSGDSILLGGLISQNKSKTKGGVPILKDIPWIGNLFASNSLKTTKSELIILIRPVIIKTPLEINSETYKFKKVLHYIDMNDL